MTREALWWFRASYRFARYLWIARAEAWTRATMDTDRDEILRWMRRSESSKILAIKPEALQPWRRSK